MILLHDVVRVIELLYVYTNSGSLREAANGSRVRTTLFYGDFPRQVLQVGGALKAAPCSTIVPPDSEQKFHRVTAVVDSAVTILTPTQSFDLGVIHFPAATN